MAFWNRVAKPSPKVTDLTHLLNPAWTSGTAQIALGAGGAVTLSVWNLGRETAATGSIPVLALPDELLPPFLLYGTKTYRGANARITSGGTVEVVDPGTILDHFVITYVPRGGA